jgi:hypothetical protein
MGSMINLDIGNAHELDTQGTGWFIGFGPWTLASPGGLRHVPREQAASGLSVKWFDHAPGHDSGDAKPVSEGRTMSILVSAGAAFRIDFSESAGFDEAGVRTVLLRQEGDYVAWGAGLFHRWRCEKRSTILTVRWNPVG